MPIIVFAVRFIVAGEVDLALAGGQLLVAAVLAVVLKAVLVWRRAVLNPLLLGVDLWLVVGAIGFNVPVPPIMDRMVVLGATSLFIAMGAVAAVMSFASRGGALGPDDLDRVFVQRASGVVVGLCVVAVWWSLWWSGDLRVGGGIPFIVVNVARRLLMRRGRG